MNRGIIVIHFSRVQPTDNIIQRSLVVSTLTRWTSKFGVKGVRTLDSMTWRNYCCITAVLSFLLLHYCILLSRQLDSPAIERRIYLRNFFFLHFLFLSGRTVDFQTGIVGVAGMCFFCFLFNMPRLRQRSEYANLFAELLFLVLGSALPDRYVFFLFLVQHGLALLGGFSLQLCELAFYVRTQTLIRKNLLFVKTKN